MDSYSAVHKWLRRKYGNADSCENGCTKGPFHWALRRGSNYLKDRNNFKKLCVGCHHKYDKIHKTGSEHFNFGKKASPETRLKMSLFRRGAKKTEAHCKNISKALKGRSLSESHKRNLAKAKRGTKLSVQTRQKMSISRMGKKRGKYRI
jgi:hypothetical protein